MSIKEKSADWIQPSSYLNLFYQKLSSMYQEQKSMKEREKINHIILGKSTA